MDSLDLAILEALQSDSRVPMEDLAERVGLSAPACYRRARRLREEGAIEREIAVVSPRTMGWTITMLVLVSLESDRGDVVDETIRRLKEAPEVIDVWLVTGDHDLVVRVVARDMERYDLFTREVLHADRDVRSFKTLVVMRQAKHMAPIPIRGTGE
jgi:Lrp/AsnC family leucine-responsive transcriptional regulator